MNTKTQKRIRFKNKIRAKIGRGTAQKPRLSVFRSLGHISAQIIDDVSGKTLVSANDHKAGKGTKMEHAAYVGKMLGEAAGKAGIETVIFDRNGFKYTGRVKALAEAARGAGLQF